MVVIGASITSRVRPLLARQFVEIRRAKVEALLNAFVKLVDYSGSDHTYLETESVRYVYQPVENLYMVLITTKCSNIFEDLGTLRMFVSIVQDTCGEGQAGGSLEESVAAHAFDVIFMLDELISGGYRESLTLQQIQSFVAMDSHEEKIQKIIAEGKEKEQKDRRREIANRLDKERLQAKKAGKGLDVTSLRGASVVSQQLRSTPDEFASSSAAPDTYWTAGTPGAGTYDQRQRQQQSSPAAACQSPQPRRGMQLNMKKSAQAEPSLLQSLVPDQHGDQSAGLGDAAQADAATLSMNPLADPVSVLVEEKIMASLQTEGGVKDVELQGTFFVTVTDATRGALAAFQLTPGNERFKLKSHPNVDKSALNTSNLLQIRDPSRPLPPHQPAPLLKWRISDKDECLVPLAVSCWPSSTPSGASITVELEVTDVSKHLNDVHLSFMCSIRANTQVLRTDAGTTEHDGVSLHWFLPRMGAELTSATIELSTSSDLASLLPFSVELSSKQSICDIDVLKCFHMESKEDIPFTLTRNTEYLLTVGP